MCVCFFQGGIITGRLFFGVRSMPPHVLEPSAVKFMGILALKKFNFTLRLLGVFHHLRSPRPPCIMWATQP